MTDDKKISLASVLVTLAIVVAVVIGLLLFLGRRTCQDRGEDHFKEIGSWPTLSDGRRASEVVTERCSRTSDAFPD